jgi:hypothetical protein
LKWTPRSSFTYHENTKQLDAPTTTSETLHQIILLPKIAATTTLQE